MNNLTRSEEEKNISSFSMFLSDASLGIAWQSRSANYMDGFLYGQVDSNGEFTGDNITFIYPDFLTGLRGSFVKGVLRKAVAVDIVAERCNTGVKELKIEPAKYNNDVVWEKEETNAKYIGKNRKVMDPHERKSVFVKNSTNPTAYEGLFARRNFSPGELVSYYGGQRLFKTDVIFENMTKEERQEASACHLALGLRVPGLPEDLLVDVSGEYRSVVEYRTTLGHKSNHSFNNNVEFWVVDHPVLGVIGCLVAQTEITAGEEIFAHYRYPEVNSVSWYNYDFHHVYGANCYSRKNAC